MLVHPHRRTQNQNALLVEKILDYLASGHTIKEAAWDYRIPHNTLTCLFSRYRRRYGFKTVYQMVAVRVITREKR